MHVHRPLPLIRWHERHASNKYTTATCIWHCSTTQTRICRMSTYWMTMMTLTSRTPYYAASMYTAILMAGTVLSWALVNFRNIHCAYCRHTAAVASGYASQHIPSRSPSPEIGRVETGRASSVKYRGLHGWAYSHSRLCGCCRPASGYTVRSVSERGRAIYQGPHQLQI